MTPELLRELNAARRERRAVMHVTDLETGHDRLVYEGDGEDDDLGKVVKRTFRSGKSVIFEGEDGQRYFLNVHLPPARIVVIGAVHISQALAPIARIAGFDLTIVDPRTAFASPERFAGVDLVAEWPDEVLEARPLDRFTALVAVTHDPKIDDGPLKAALAAECFYVGALGSRKTHGRRVERLSEAGVKDAALERIAAPIGLDIGAASPGEIAVAIMAEIIQALRKREPLANASAKQA
ncbi:XdhC family protein [Pararhizobium mangrovi]|uniref:XdhC family protein n=1 Tax=Pararhizobium mangrovi TaxID=2590452 RepID=A0A506TXM8_9HYPH|nr:XdhC family protein [Pararhizobium mangrovi]TPW26812.1 XdhC family protein [Pararhizobium mangrovi]